MGAEDVALKENAGEEFGVCCGCLGNEAAVVICGFTIVGTVNGD